MKLEDLSPMQQSAVVAKGNVLVSAAAGSGKTSVLVERVIKKLLHEKIDANRLLIVTFTNAAAKEMKGRIEGRLYEESVLNPNDSDITRQRHLVSNSDISTIDSFCINLVRQNFQDCDVEPDFKIADTASELKASEKALEICFERFFNYNDKDILMLCELVGCKYSDAELKELIVDIYNYSRVMPFPNEFIAGLKAPYEQAFDKSNIWFKKAMKEADSCLRVMKEKTEKMAQHVSNFENAKAAEKGMSYAETLSDITSELELELESLDWDGIKAFLDGLVLGNFPSAETADPVYDEYKKYKEAYSKKALKAFSALIGSSVFDFDAAEKLVSEMLNNLDSAQKKANLMRNKSTAQKSVAYIEKLTAYINKLSQAVKAQNLVETERIFRKLSASSPNASEKDFNTKLYKLAKDDFIEIIDRLKEIFHFDVRDIEEYKLEMLPIIEKLFCLLEAYADALQDIFKSENIYTFAEIEQRAFALLCQMKDGKIELTEAAKEISQSYEEVMVDEFQDVNDLQNALFYALSDEGKKLFVVGDVKQSIYGFRGSNPENFLKKLEKEDSAAVKIFLSENYRSRKGICAFVNFFFSLFMQGQCGRLIYDEKERLNPNRSVLSENDCDVELLILDKGKEDEEDLVNAEYEARAIAEYIQKLMNGPMFLYGKDKSLRPTRYSDFTILLDKLTNATTISQIISEYGIPIASAFDSYVESYEIALTLSLLQVIDNPKSDIELFAVMMSPLYGFTAEKIAEIKSQNEYRDLYYAVNKAASAGNSECERLMGDLRRMRADAAVMSLSELIMKLIFTTELLNIVSAMPSGEQKRANLLALPKFAAEYSSAVRGSVSGFVRYIKSLPNKAFKNSENGGDCVKINTMHSSKGLQYPICILARLSGEINLDDTKEAVIYEDEAGVVFRHYDEQNDIRYSSLGHLLAKYSTKSSIIDEKLRLLYVAMTRAEEKLVLVSFLKDLKADLEKISPKALKENSIDAQWLRSTKSMGSWIIASALLHPDCKELKELAFHPYSADTYDSKINMQIINCSELKMPESQEAAEEISENAELSEKLRGIIKSENSEYIYDEFKRVKSKASVSILAHKDSHDEYDFRDKPSFMYENGISPAGRGTAMHHVMQHICMDRVPNVDDELKRLLDGRYISRSQADACDKKAIESFFKSDVFKRILLSSDVRREMRFMTATKASQVYSGLLGEAANATVYIQGAVDLCFAEADGIVVLDFKTDRVSDENQLISAYGKQLEIYADACEKIFGATVKERIIYSFHLGKEIKL